MIRGKGLGLEVVLSEHDVGRALADLDAHLAEQPEFYRGGSATALFGESVPTPEQLADLCALLDARGIALRALSGGAEVEQLARSHALDFTIAASPAVLSPAARSLVADFAGARSDIAARRKRGEASVRRPDLREPQLRLVEAVTTLYHTGTLRGGQALHHVGNLVVVGDVNPGAEVVATGDVIVFGRLCGVAHAGAQGDEAARVYAIHLDAVQLRIASCIAAEDDAASPRPSQPEVAFVRDAHIVIVPFNQMGASN
ncbi:MAG TPA: septum site-determining protein MinC [Candidatus Tyrphobacter sp.]